MNVAVVAGEASGDIQAANLLREVAMLLPVGENLTAWGIGGQRLRELGCEIVADSGNWGSISIAESVTKASTVLSAMHKFKHLLIQREPDLLILVDFGALNIPLASWLKKRKAVVPGHFQCPIFYYFPPSSWRRKVNVKKLQRLTSVSDLIVTPFSWSADLLKKAGGDAHFVGHPLLDTVKTTMSADAFDSLYGIDKSKTVIALLPGSREHEVRHILPALLAAAGEVARRLPGVQFLLARSPNLSRSLIEDILYKAQSQGTPAALLHLAQQAGDLIKHASSAWTPPLGERVNSLATPEGILIQPEQPKRDWLEKRISSAPQTAPLAIVDGLTIDAMSRSDLVIAASGTATLEAAIMGRPTIIVYKGSALMNLEYAVRKKALDVTFIGMPNILAGQIVCPEFLQDDVNGLTIADAAVDMLLQPEKLISVKRKLKEVIKDNLGEPGATKRAAELMMSYFYGKHRASEDVPSEAR